MNGPRRAGEGLLVLVITFGFVVAAHFDRFALIEGHVFSAITEISSQQPRDDIVIVDIDEPSLQRVGAWPWRRSVVAELINRIAEGEPKVIATTLTFDQPEKDPALEVLDELTEKLAQTMGSEWRHHAHTRIDLARNERSDAVRSDAQFVASDSGASIRTELQALERGLSRLRDVLDGDRLLADAIAASGEVVLGLRTVAPGETAAADATLPRFVSAHVIGHPTETTDRARRPHEGVIAPIAIIGRKARDLGTLPAPRAGARGGWAVIESTPYGFLPSVPLVLASRALGLSISDIDIRFGEGVALGEKTLATGARFRLWASGVGGDAMPHQDSAADLLAGKISPERYRDRVVLIGPTTPGLDPAWLSITNERVPLVVALAQMTSSLLNQDTAYRPIWVQWVDWGILGLVGLYLLLVLPRLRPGPGIALSAAGVMVLASAQIASLLGASVWLHLATALLLLVTGHLALAAQRGLGFVQGPTAQAETGAPTRQSELSRRQIAQLDQTFERLQRVPLDESIMGQLYEIGVAFERERMPRKSVAVFRYIAAHNPRFRDVREKIRALNASWTYPDDPAEGGDARASEGGKPGPFCATMLGRYRIERELGQGAMGVVYLGTDSKIGRTVAIKTMALSQEFEEDDLDAIKQRFFREAETAGRLSHPNIVTIYDVGEEQDLAYIAMEYLGGRNLRAFTRADKLLPLDDVLEIIAKCADTLAFAHARHVVHRDIKPANVMFEPTTGALKITDFGIARITDSSKTKRGMVLGTPSYMSPEQLAGQQVDGRSDLFSLGVMLFQMTTGQLPFRSDSMASLMFKIANEAHPPLRALRTDAPPCLQIIVDKALGKQAESRYQSGSQMARDLRECAKKITM